jgi:hypothetical protein
MEIPVPQQKKDVQMRVTNALQATGFNKGVRKRIQGNLISPWHFPDYALKQLLES